MKNEIQRYNANERSNHWAVAILFFMAGCPGWRCSTRRCSG
ncbi:nitrate-inducible formate dehydrogenase subunit gamma [Pseudomonas aeruginosa]|nr:nitrate-inducible formate dehydrogenase subunit gamma [Pseudomonas aeruginosa]